MCKTRTVMKKSVIDDTLHGQLFEKVLLGLAMGKSYSTGGNRLSGTIRLVINRGRDMGQVDKQLY